MVAELFGSHPLATVAELPPNTPLAMVVERPHLDLTQEEPDRRHPSLVRPDDEQLDDLANDAHDLVYQTGVRLAEAVRDET